MSKSLEFSVGRMSNPDISCYSDSDWNKAVEQPSEEFFDKYLNGNRALHVDTQDESGQRFHADNNLSFNADGDFQYCATESCVCDGTLIFLEHLKEKLVEKVCCLVTVCKTCLPIQSGDTIDCTIGNFIVLTEDCESPDKDKPWLIDRFIVALPLKTCKRNKMISDE